jgi:hypothetical protein
MNTPPLLKTVLMVGSAVAILTLISTPIRAQWVKVPPASVPRTADGKPNLSAAAPRLPDGKPDLSGTFSRLITSSMLGYPILTYRIDGDHPVSAWPPPRPSAPSNNSRTED